MLAPTHGCQMAMASTVAIEKISTEAPATPVTPFRQWTRYSLLPS
jgi:hypothetical protein